MKMITKYTLHCAFKKIGLLILVAGMSFGAWAITLDQAKQQGLVGEMPNGYLGSVVVNTEVTTLVSQVNKKRKDIYINLARKNKITLQQVSQLAGKKSIAKTKTGHFIKSATGQWVKKQ